MEQIPDHPDIRCTERTGYPRYMLGNNAGETIWGRRQYAKKEIYRRGTSQKFPGKKQERREGGG